MHFFYEFSKKNASQIFENFTEKIPQIILRDFQFFSDERRTCR